MPRHEFTCSAGHTTEKTFRIKDEVPASIRCKVPRCGYRDCREHRPCGRRAKKSQVYRVGVQGSLPTRGAF